VHDALRAAARKGLATVECSLDLERSRTTVQVDATGWTWQGRPVITRPDLLVINKIDLAPLVGASLEVMDRREENARRAAIRVLEPDDRPTARRNREIYRNGRNTMRSAATALIVVSSGDYAHPSHGALEGHFHGFVLEHLPPIAVAFVVSTFAVTRT